MDRWLRASKWEEPQQSIGDVWQPTATCKMKHWYIKGPAREVYAILAQEVGDLLSHHEISMDFYPLMRGTCEDKAEPVIILHGTDAKSRGRAAKLIAAELMTDPRFTGFRVDHQQHLPGMGAPVFVMQQTSGQSHPTKFDIPAGIMVDRDRNAIFCIAHEGGPPSYGTLSAPIIIGDSMYLMTTSHLMVDAAALLEGELVPNRVDSRQSRVGNLQESSSSGSSHNDEEDVAATSYGSRSADTDSVNSAQSYSWDVWPPERACSEASDASTPSLMDSPQHETASLTTEQSHEDTDTTSNTAWWQRHLKSFELVMWTRPRITCYIGSPHLDYALVHVPVEMQSLVVASLTEDTVIWPQKDYQNQFSEPLDVYVNTTHGIFLAVLQPIPITTTFSSELKSRKLYMVVGKACEHCPDCGLTGRIRKGDSGASVQSANTYEGRDGMTTTGPLLYGHIVAADEATGTGYMVAANDISDDIESKFGYRPETWTPHKFACRDKTSSPQRALGKQSISYPIIETTNFHPTTDHVEIAMTSTERRPLEYGANRSPSPDLTPTTAPTLATPHSDPDVESGMTSTYGTTNYRDAYNSLHRIEMPNMYADGNLAHTTSKPAEPSPGQDIVKGRKWLYPSGAALSPDGTITHKDAPCEWCFLGCREWHKPGEAWHEHNKSHYGETPMPLRQDCPFEGCKVFWSQRIPESTPRGSRSVVRRQLADHLWAVRCVHIDDEHPSCAGPLKSPSPTLLVHLLASGIINTVQFQSLMLGRPDRLTQWAMPSRGIPSQAHNTRQRSWTASAPNSTALPMSQRSPSELPSEPVDV